MKYFENVIFFVAVCVYLHSYPAHGDYVFGSYSNSTLNRIKRQAKPKTCTPAQYKCKNNQCVSSTVVCDGVRNCLDGSDELWAACESRYPNSCILPAYSQEHSYIVNCDSSTAIKIFPSSKGDFVQELTLLSLSCNDGASSSGQLQSVCLKGKWTPQLSSCIKTCDPTPKAHSAKIKCYVGQEEVECNRNHSPGTVIRPQCDAGVTPNVEEAVCDDSGKWHVDQFECLACGANVKQTTPPFQYPWNVAIYSKDYSVLICAGTIVAPTVVATAASCFDDEGIKTPANYIVVVGKKKRDFHSHDSKSQKNHSIRKIHIHQNYQEDSSTNDIALIELNDKIVYNTEVYPVCVDWDNSRQIFVKPNTIGHVANYIVNDTLGTAKHSFYIPLEMEVFFESNLALYYIPQSSCINAGPSQELRKSYIGEDKFCVRRQNEQPLIHVDKGTGYFIEFQSKYYLLGIASGMFSPWNTFRIFTDVLKHGGWGKPILNEAAKKYTVPKITTVEKKTTEMIVKSDVFTYDSLKINCSNGDIYTEFIGGCVLPSKSLYNIDYNIKCVENIFQSYCNHSGEGAPVPQYTSLEYKCKNGYYSYGPEASASVCFQGTWTQPISQCGRICSKIKPQNVIIKCVYEGKEISCDDKLIVNTEVIPISCLPEYRRNASTNSGSIYCRENGQWSGQLLKCVPICGHPSRTTITPTIVGGNPVLLGEFPWHAAVYEKPANNTLICGATIISPYSLLSAAHCFYDRNNDRQKNPADYEIGVSKITRDRFTRDSETTVFYEVETLIFNNFRGLQLRFQRDIVIIVTKTKISFNSQVSPICLFKDPSLRIGSNAILDVAGWGIDESGKETGSPILKVAHMPYISFDECSKIAPASITEYLATEKFCTRGNTSSLEQGDSGGGLVLKNSIDYSYYLVGIVSFKAKAGVSISLNTYVLDYLSWINNKLNEIHVVKNEIFD